MRKARQGLGLLGLVLLTGFTVFAQRDRSVLLPVSEAKTLTGQCSRSSPTGFTRTWVPAKSDIRKMESKFSQINRAKIPDPKKYYMQYVGIVIKGKKYIYINALLTTNNDDRWKKRAIVVCDGGADFWGVLYDVKSKTFSDLAINGVA